MPRKAKKCPVGLVCFRIKVRHIALLILLLSVFFIFLVCNKKKNTQAPALQSNFDNLNILSSDSFKKAFNITL